MEYLCGHCSSITPPKNCHYPDKAKMAVVFAEHNRQACDMNNTRFTAADVFLGACFPVDLKILSLLQDAAAAPEKALLVPA